MCKRSDKKKKKKKDVLACGERRESLGQETRCSKNESCLVDDDPMKQRQERQTVFRVGPFF